MSSTAATTTDRPWAWEADAALAAVGSDAGGLTAAEAASRLQRHGRNVLPAPKPTPWWRRLLAQYDDVLTYILVAAAVLKAISGDWIEFTVIAVVIVATGLLGFIQEGRATSALASLTRMQSLDAQVLRGGAWGVIDAADLVTGDIVRVRSGSKVPADLRLLTATNLRVDEAALTGESEPVSKTPAANLPDAAIGDRSAILHSGTIVATGEGQGVVVATGADTAIGAISTLVAEQEQLETPLARQLARLGKQISILIGILAVAMLLIGRLVHDAERDELISAAIGFAVAAVPEGLPALVTITLALGVQQMAKRRAITRKMDAVETLGAMNVICSDKTGTLTQNEMTARTVVTATGTYAVEGQGYDPHGRIVAGDGETADPARHPDLAALVTSAAVCNDAKVEQTDEGWRVVGQPTEGALDVLASKSGVDVTGIRRLGHLPFESSVKFSATVDVGTTGPRMLHVSGAPDRLLDRSTSQLTGGARVDLDRAAWERHIDELSAKGLRLLAEAQRPAGDLTDEIDVDDVTELTFLGLVGIVDPPRPEVRDAITEAHGAGVRVKMITGDHRGTATAIARELGIVAPDGNVPALTGADIERMSQDQLADVVRDVDVYARTSPEHKLRIVRALQSHRQVVGMTGDGVNDAPSITRADVGIAMGIKGTEATKEAADVVLADDNFATIVRAVEEGRRIYDNIRKSVVFLLPTNGAQSLVILVAVLLGIALPLSPVQILWINLVCAVTLTVALAGEPAEPGIMTRPPRSAKEQVLNGRMLVLVLVVSVLIGGAAVWIFEAEQRLTGSYAQAQTSAVLMLALGQLAFLFNCRRLNSSSLTWRVLTGNNTVWISCAAMLALQVVFTYAPFMNQWFDSAPISLRQWGTTAALAVAVFLVVEAVKAALRATERRR
ncbi:cation-translocating P-type ATPase [Microbacterium sp. bgisy189]|uniref:cation-translocating P-type ATPase n=1 Tax=Microbacterium sp. bgisy189 TaxID=3413798 RepID=UPI003EBE7980